MKKIYYMMLLALLTMTTTMTSCRDWDSDTPYSYYVEDVVGSWVSYYGHDYYGDYDILGRDVVRYDFYSNYTGRYTRYSYYGYDLETIGFDWDTYGDRLVIYYYDGDREYLYYGFDRNGDLLLATDSHFYQYTAYRPAGYYYEQGKALPDVKSTVTEGKTTTTVKTVSRAIKARAEE